MIAIKTQLTLIFLVISVAFAFGQERFERRYPTSGETFLTTSIHPVGEGFLLFSTEIDDDGLWPQLNLTSLDNKGNVNWSNNYLYGDTTFIREIGEVITDSEGGIIFSAILQKDSLNKLITRVDGEGNFLWSKLAGQFDDLNSSPPGRTNLVDFNGQFFINTNRTSGDSGLDVLISSHRYDGEQAFSKRLSPMDTSGNAFDSRVRDAINTVDSALIIVGNTTSANHQLFLTKMDTSGNVMWSKSYTGAFSEALDETALSIAELEDSTLVILGARAGGITTPFIVQLDFNGNYIKSRTINATGGFEFFPNNIIGMKGGDVAISFKRLNSLTAEVQPIVMKYDMDSTSSYRTLLKVTTDRIIDRSGLSTSDSMSIAYGGTTYDDDSTMMIPYLAKLNEDGVTLCNDDIMDFAYDSVFFSTDTLIWTAVDLEASDTMRTRVISYGGFNPPTLTLQDTTYCPQDPIRYFVDAAVEGGVAYLWDDNNTDSARIFTEEGMFSVTVTVAGDICFTLCDTVNITVAEEPMAAIITNSSNFCSDGSIGLLVQSNNNITAINWSTGENTQVIIVDELTNYSVEITDECGLTATASIDLSDFRIARNPDLGISQERLCIDNTIIIQITNTDLIDIANVIWSNGEVGVGSIIVSEPGNYTAENMEQFCPGESTIAIGQNLFLEDLTAEIVDICNDPIQLIIQGSASIVSQRWFDGRTTTSTTVTEAGVYTVEVTDVCGETLTASIEITDDRIMECINPPTGEACLQWPNTFIPASNETANQSFGPYSECGTVENYELNIYNRWGKNIFTSANVDTRWDGTVGGSDAPGGVYFYTSSYSDSVDTFQDEGDVTLVR